jgi:hypothetical protein
MFEDLPALVIVKIAEKTLDVCSIIRLLSVNKSTHNVLDPLYKDMVMPRFQHYYPQLSKDAVFDCELHLDKFLTLTKTFYKVAHLEKTARFQYLLNDCYNQKIYSFDHTSNISKESSTFHLLLKLFHYAKERLPQSKVNLSPWALYMVLDYISSCLSRSHNCVFRTEEMAVSVIERLFALQDQMVRTRMKPEIKLRLLCLLDHLHSEYGMYESSDPGLRIL